MSAVNALSPEAAKTERRSVEDLASMLEDLYKEDDVDVDDRLLELLSNSLSTQAEATRALAEELKHELRSTRNWVIGLVALCLVLMTSLVGVSASVRALGFGIVTGDELAEDGE